MRVQIAFDFGQRAPEVSTDSQHVGDSHVGDSHVGDSHGAERADSTPAVAEPLDIAASAPLAGKPGLQLGSELVQSPGAAVAAAPRAVDSDLWADDDDDPYPFESDTRFTRVGLEMHLQVLCGRELTLRLTDNERTMISTRNHRGVLMVRAHHMFLDAPPAVVAALGGYLAQTDTDAPRLLFDFIKGQRERIRRRVTPRMMPLRSQGDYHDLQCLFDQLNHHYFAAGVRARIGWGKHSSSRRRTRRSIKLGSYRSADALIRIHPVLDASWVPSFFVAFIVYHEMLHQVVAPTIHGRRREYHSPEFRARERQFEAYAEAMAWERAHLRRLLRS